MALSLQRQFAILGFMALAVYLSACGSGTGDAAKNAVPGPAHNAGTGPGTEAPPGSLELVFPFGSENQDWLKAVTQDFNAAKNKTKAGKDIFVTLKPMGSGECMEEVRTGRI